MDQDPVASATAAGPAGFHVLPAFSRLFEAVRIGRVTLRNRLVMLPMETNCATEGGLVTDRTRAYYRARAAHVGLVLIRITCVESVRGKGYRFQLCIDHDGTVPGLRELAGSL